MVLAQRTDALASNRQIVGTEQLAIGILDSTPRSRIEPSPTKSHDVDATDLRTVRDHEVRSNIL